MDEQALTLSLAALAFALALNLQLTLAAVRAARRGHDAPPRLLPGERVPVVEAGALAAGARVRLAAPGQSWALLFLSSKCPKCREKLPGIDAMAGAAREAGLSMWIVSEEPRWRLRGFLRNTALAAMTARVDRTGYRTLNPNKASPAYLFVNHEGVLEASGLIGDDDWLALQAQLAGAQAVDRAA